MPMYQWVRRQVTLLFLRADALPRRYSGDGLECADVDECQINNGNCGDSTFKRCVNQLGAPNTCEDIKECASDNGGCGNSSLIACQVGSLPCARSRTPPTNTSPPFDLPVHRCAGARWRRTGLCRHKRVCCGQWRLRIRIYVHQPGCEAGAAAFMSR